MNTRNRPGRRPPAPLRPAPFGLGTPSGALQVRQSVHEVASIAGGKGGETNVTSADLLNPACATQSGRQYRHPLTNEMENRRLLAHEQTIKQRFANIVPAL